MVRQCYCKKFNYRHPNVSFHSEDDDLSSTLSSEELNTDDRIDFDFVDPSSAAGGSCNNFSMKMEFEDESVTIKTEEPVHTDINSLFVTPSLDPADDYCLLNESVVKLEDMKVEIDEFCVPLECMPDLMGKIKEEIDDS